MEVKIRKIKPAADGFGTHAVPWHKPATYGVFVGDEQVAIIEGRTRDSYRDAGDWRVYDKPAGVPGARCFGSFPTLRRAKESAIRRFGKVL